MHEAYKTILTRSIYLLIIIQNRMNFNSLLTVELLYNIFFNFRSVGAKMFGLTRPKIVQTEF